MCRFIRCVKAESGFGGYALLWTSRPSGYDTWGVVTLLMTDDYH